MLRIGLEIKGNQAPVRGPGRQRIGASKRAVVDWVLNYQKGGTGAGQVLRSYKAFESILYSRLYDYRLRQLNFCQLPRGLKNDSQASLATVRVGVNADLCFRTGIDYPIKTVGARLREAALEPPVPELLWLRPHLFRINTTHYLERSMKMLRINQGFF